MRGILHFLVLVAVGAQQLDAEVEVEVKDFPFSATEDIVGGGEVSVGGGRISVAATNPGIEEGTLYSLRATPFTDQAGIGAYNDIESLSEWGRRLAIGWYLDRACPCNYGCPPGMCTWCEHDVRYPEWWPEYRRRGYNTTTTPRPRGAMVEEHPFATEGMMPGLEDLYRCDQSYDRIETTMNPVVVDKEDSSVKSVTTRVKFEVVGERGFSTVGNGQFATTWRYPEAYLFHVVLYTWNHLRNGFKETHKVEEAASYIPIHPVGIRGAPVFWPMKTNYYETRYAVTNFLRYTVKSGAVFVPKCTDVLVWFDAIAHRVTGYATADLALSAEFGKRLYYTFKLDNFSIELGGDLAPLHHGIAEFECGPPTNPPLCRTHTQPSGRVINRVYGDWNGLIAPFVNRTVYEWDVSLEHADPIKTDWTQRYNAKIISVTTLSLSKDYEIENLPIGRSNSDDLEADADQTDDYSSSTQQQQQLDYHQDDEEEEMNLISDIDLDDLVFNEDLYDLNSLNGDVMPALDDWKTFKLY